jgi:hypothetical protein
MEQINGATAPVGKEASRAGTPGKSARGKAR